MKACERSLKRLKTDFINLYLIHWLSNQHPIQETMGAMEKLVDEGLIKLIGTRNFSLEQLKKARHALIKYTIVCNQVLFHLAYRGIE
jgi:diketogulonate reductase-like aldo/keto reductase